MKPSSEFPPYYELIYVGFYLNVILTLALPISYKVPGGLPRCPGFILMFPALNIFRFLVKFFLMIGFTEYYNTVTELEYLFNRNDTMEDFLEDVSSSNIGIGAVTTSDVAINTLPLSLLRRKNPIQYEELKKNKEAQVFIKENMAKYKNIYRKDAEYVLNSVAEHLFLKNK